MPDVVVIDSGGANLASLGFALSRLGVDSTVSADPARIRRASHVLLPGVGSAHDAMSRLASAGLTQVIPQLTQPLLGICLGMQLLFQSSAESPADHKARRAWESSKARSSDWPARRIVPCPTWAGTSWNPCVG